MTTRPEKRNLRILALNALALLAFVFHSFLPAGFMPGQDSGGKASIVICTASGLKTVDAAAGGNDHEKDKTPECAFAPLLTQNFAPAASAVAPPDFNGNARPPAWADLIRLSPSTQIYDSQGPPQNS